MAAMIRGDKISGIVDEKGAVEVGSKLMQAVLERMRGDDKCVL